MARRIKGKYYDLNQTFSDEEGNRYSRRAADTLVLWMNMSETPTDKGPKSLTVSYEGSPTTSASTMVAGGTIRDTVTFSDSGDKNGLVAANAALSPSTLTSGGTPTTTSDLPFSVSFWVNFSSYPIGDPHYLFAKDSTGGYEYLGSLTTAKKLELIISDAVNSKLQSIITSTAVDSDSVFKGLNAWNHLVFTYDGRAGNTAYAGMKIYINGVSRTVQNDGSQTGYVGIRPTHTLPLYVGSLYDGTDEVDGQMAEFCMWKGYELTASNVKALYNVSARDRGIMSGIISNPNRVVLQTQDNRTGSYPTIARTGDPDFTGRYISPFDDTNTIIFEGADLVYPTNLRSTSKFVSGGVATPNTLQGLIGAGTSSAGVADAHISLTPGENISPFNESRVLIGSSPFYLTGTAPSVLPGFSQRLSSKTILTIDTTPKSRGEIFWSTGTVKNASGFNEGVSSGISYFSFEDRAWQSIGNLTSGSHVDYLNQHYSTAASSLLSIVPSTHPESTGGDLPIETAFGLPISTFGYPFASKFDATGSQHFHLTSSMTAPFLVEKVVFEFSGTISGPAFDKVGGSPTEPVVQTFVLMRESQAPTAGTFTVTSKYLDRDPTPDLIITTSNTYTTSKHREIVWFGRAACHEDNDFPTAADIQEEFPNIFKSADLWVPSVGSISGYPTGSFRLEAPTRVCGFAPFSSPMINNRVDALVGDDYVVGNAVGGASLKDISNGRSFIKSTMGSQVTGSSYTWTGGITADKYVSYFGTAPFVLLPSDKLVFAAIHQIAAAAIYLDEGANARRDRLTIAPDSSKLTLFGSLLRNNLPVDPEFNQPLTSNAIHEALHSDNPVYDQFDVEPRASFTGSYVDNIITGSMVHVTSNFGASKVTITPVGPYDAGVRKVQASVAAGQAGTTGSLQRFVRLTDSSGKIYDSYPPSLANVLLNKLNRGLIITASNGEPLLSVGTPDYTNAPLLGSDSDWYLRTAYEISAVRFTDQSFKNIAVETFNLSNVSQARQNIGLTNTIFMITGSTRGATISDGRGNINNSVSFRNSIKAAFGFGDAPYNAPVTSPDPFVNWATAFVVPRIRGYKYGLGGLFGSSLDARFRRDKYGQFRDMLEQRRIAAITVDGGVEYPLSINFRGSSVNSDTGLRGAQDPNKTHSQNLSVYATSSKPYYDGLAVERPDDPDVTLRPYEVT